MDPDELGNLIQNDNEAYAGFETRQHWIRDEAGDDPEAKQARQKQKYTHQQGQGGACSEERCGSAAPGDLAQDAD